MQELYREFWYDQPQGCHGTAVRCGCRGTAEMDGRVAGQVPRWKARPGPRSQNFSRPNGLPMPASRSNGEPGRMGCRRLVTPSPLRGGWNRSEMPLCR